MKPFECPSCNGTRTRDGQPCPTCRGEGVVWQPVEEAAVGADDALDITDYPAT